MMRISERWVIDIRKPINEHSDVESKDTKAYKINQNDHASMNASSIIDDKRQKSTTLSQGPLKPASDQMPQPQQDFYLRLFL